MLISAQSALDLAVYFNAIRESLPIAETWAVAAKIMSYASGIKTAPFRQPVLLGYGPRLYDPRLAGCFMARKCFISFKTEDFAYKIAIQNQLQIDMVDRSLNVAIDSQNEDYIMQRIRGDYLSDSTVTIHLIGEKSAELYGPFEQRFIKRELQASLYDGVNNPRSGILGVVLPPMYDRVYLRDDTCGTCGCNLSIQNIGDETMIREFYVNYHIPHGKCHWMEDDRYCVLTKWDDFARNPDLYIERAFLKRTHPISKKVKVRP